MHDSSNFCVRVLQMELEMEIDAKKLAGSHAENDQLFQKTLVKIEAIHIFVAIQLNTFSSPSFSFSNMANTCGWREQMEKRFGIRQSFAFVNPLAYTLSGLSAFKNYADDYNISEKESRKETNELSRQWKQNIFNWL